MSIWWLREQACLRTKECQVYQFEPSTSISRPFESVQRTSAVFCTSCYVVGPRDSFCVKILPSWYVFSCSGRNSWFEHFLVLTDNVFVRFTFTLSASQICMIETWCWFVKINKFHEFLPHWSHILFFQPFWCHPRIPIRTILVFDEQIGIRNSVLFPIQVPIEPPQSVSPQEANKRVTVQNSFKKNHWACIAWARFGPLVSWKTYPCIWTFRLWNLKQPWSVLHFYLGVSWYCVGGLSSASW